MHIRRHRTGWIEVICGSMFSGKTEELIRRVRRALLGRQHVQVFKPAIDNRYHATRITSHSAMEIDAEVVTTADEIAALVRAETEVVGVDEAQFFTSGMPELAQSLADQGRRVIIAGLDQDYRGQPFDPMPQLLAVAEEITKCLAVCAQCGAPANRSQRLVIDEQAADARIVVGAAERYEARCRACFESPLAPPALARSAAG